MADLPTDGVNEDRRLEYIKAMIEWTADDAKQVYVRVTGAVGIAVLFLTQLPFGRLANLSTVMRYVLIVGIGSLLLSAISYFTYVSKTHIARRELARHLLNANHHGARTALSEVWRKWRWTFWLGNTLFGFGTASLGLVLARVLGLP
jgi:hypothetical protein